MSSSTSIPVFADLRRTTEPTLLPVDVATLKLHARVDTSIEDALLATYLGAAIDRVENHCRRSLMPQAWRLTLNRWPSCSWIPLPMAPVTTVNGVDFTDENGDQADLNASERRLIPGEPPRLAPPRGATWPAVASEGAGIAITYTTGYADADAVPESIKSAILLIATHYYEHRMEVVMGGAPAELPSGVRSLLSRWVIPELTTEIVDGH